MSTIVTLKLAVDIGHNVPFDSGAAGIRDENTLNHQVGTKLMEKCRAAGIQVIDCTPRNVTSLSDSLKKRVDAANKAMADFFISIHHNSSPGGAGKGTEILCIKGGRAEAVGRIILPEIVKLGFANRGVTDRRNLYVIKATVMPAVIVECAFCDNAQDMANYDTGRMAEAIFAGICRAFGIAADGSALYHVVVRGDTLSQLAKEYGTSVKAIAELNGIKNVDFIVVGQRLRIR